MSIQPQLILNLLYILVFLVGMICAAILVVFFIGIASAIKDHFSKSISLPEWKETKKFIDTLPAKKWWQRK